MTFSMDKLNPHEAITRACALHLCGFRQTAIKDRRNAVFNNPPGNVNVGIDHGLPRRIGPSGFDTCGVASDLLLVSPAGTTTWRCTTAGTRARPCWGSSAGRSRRPPSSPATGSSSSSSCPTTRPTGRGSPYDTRSSKQVGLGLRDRASVSRTGWRPEVRSHWSFL